MLACPGAHRYSCPSDKLLDVSWHITPDPIQHPLENFLVGEQQFR